MGTMLLVHRAIPPRTPSPSPPLLMLLHGIGADEEDLLPLAPSLDPRFLVVSARAPDPEPPGYRWFAIDWEIWPPSADPAEMAESRELLARFVEESIAEYRADASRVFLLGFSQGAMMSLALLMAHPALLRGVVAHSGRLERLPGGDATAEELSHAEALILHGEEDPVVPFAEGRKAHQALASLMGPRAAFIGFPGLGHGISQDGLREASRWLTARLDALQAAGAEPPGRT
jgi:phospholipase/carboxylesterase